MGRTSGAAQQANKTLGGSLRHKTVKIGLKNLIRDQSLVPHFFRTSQAVGIVRFFVAVLANRAVSRFLVTTNRSDGETLQVSQSWFASLMAIVRGVFKGRMPKLKSEALDPVKDDACSLLADFGDVKTWCNQKVDGVYTDVFHAQLASEMMTSAEEHVLRNFEKRLDRHFRTVILDVFSSGNQDIEYRMLAEIAMRASKACLAPTEDDSWKASLLEQIESMVNQAETASNHIIEEIRAQRFQLESYGLLKAHSWKNKSGEKSLSSELASVLRIGYNVIATDRRNLFFNRMLEYTARLSLVQSDRLDRLRQELSQEQSSPADAATPNPVRKVDFTRSHRPTPFSALPYYRLKPAQVMYSFSQYSALVKQIVGTVKLGKRKRCENMKPPEHDDIPEQEWLNELDELPEKGRQKQSAYRSEKQLVDYTGSAQCQRCYQETTALKRAKHDGPMGPKSLCTAHYEKEAYGMSSDPPKDWSPSGLRDYQPSPDTFVKHLFHLKKFKGCGFSDESSQEKWFPLCFRTNGVETAVTFAGSGVSAGDALRSQGYKIPEMKEGDTIDLNKPGLYRVTQNRNDLTHVDWELTPEDTIDMVAVDPGKRVPIESSTAPLSSDTNWAPANTPEDLERWRVTYQEFMEGSGREHNAEVENRRRFRRGEDTAYGAALKALQEVSKRSCRLNDVEKYSRAVLNSFMPMSKELFDEKRSHRKWYAERVRQSAYSRWMDHLFDRETTRESVATIENGDDRFKKRIPRWKRGELTEEKRLQIKKKLLQRISDRRNNPRRRVVFFGDGSFGASMKGSASVPKKELLKLLAARGPTVLLDEFRTSRMCPCGEDTLKDANESQGRRLRCHTAIVTDCPLSETMCQRGPDQDRDSLATMNMLHCAQMALKQMPRPQFLCR